MITARMETAREDLLEVSVTTAEAPPKLMRYLGVGRVWSPPPSTLDFAAVALAQYAAAAGDDLHLDGPVHSDLLTNLDEYLRIWSVWRPDKFTHVQITANEEVTTGTDADRRGAVMGYSGGVDSAFALAAHSSGALGRQARPVDLGVLVLGWDIRHGDQVGAQRAEASVRRSLREYDADLVVVSTNFQQEFCPAWFMMFNAGLTSVLHTFAPTHSAAVHATDQNYLEEFRTGPYGSHTAINHLLGRTDFPVVSTGGTHSRIERLRLLAEHPVLVDELRVCYQEGAGGANCGRCGKCLRTSLEMRAAGLDPQRSFPVPFTVEDLLASTVNTPIAFWRFADLYDRLDPADPWRAPIKTWLDRERLAKARRRGGPLARVADLEEELALAKAEIAELRGAESRRGARRLLRR